MPVWKEILGSMFQRNAPPRTSDIDLSPRREGRLPYNLRDPRPATVEAENALWKGGPRPRTKDIDLSIKELIAKEEAKQPFGPVNEEESSWDRESMPVPQQELEKKYAERGMSEDEYYQTEREKMMDSFLGKTGMSKSPNVWSQSPGEYEGMMGMLGMGPMPREEDINLPGRSTNSIPQSSPLLPYSAMSGPDRGRNVGYRMPEASPMYEESELRAGYKSAGNRKNKKRKK